MIFGASLHPPQRARLCSAKNQGRAPVSHTEKPVAGILESVRRAPGGERRLAANIAKIKKGTASTHSVRCVRVSAIWERSNEVRNFANANA